MITKSNSKDKNIYKTKRYFDLKAVYNNIGDLEASFSEGEDSNFS